MKIIFTKSPSGEPFKLAYHVGEKAEINDKQAKELIDHGFAIAEDADAPAPTKEKKPAKKAAAQ